MSSNSSSLVTLLISQFHYQPEITRAHAIISRRNLLEQEGSLPLAKPISFPEITLQSVCPAMRCLAPKIKASISVHAQYHHSS